MDTTTESVYSKTTTEAEKKEGVLIKGKNVIVLDAPEILPSPETPLLTNAKDIVGAINELKKLSSGEGGDDWQPPADWLTVPEPGSYEVCMLVDVVPSENGKVNVGFRLGITMLYKDSSGNWNNMDRIGPLTVDWGDGTVLTAQGYDYDAWAADGSFVGDGWYLPDVYDINRHCYTTAGKYVIKITSNEHSNFLNLLMKEGSLGNIYTLMIKCGSGILVGQPPDCMSSLNEDWFIKFNQRLQYIKYGGEGANFPRTGFNNCYSLRKVETVNPYKEIYQATPAGSSSVIGCANLTDFDFSECGKITNVQFSYGAFKKINLPKCTDIIFENINTGIFQNCTNLTEISAPLLKNISVSFCQNCYALKTVNFEQCTVIENYAFYCCYNLSKLYLPECTSIGNYAFLNCYALTEIYAPKCVNVGEYAFSGCYSLEKATFADGCTFGSYAIPEWVSV